MMCLQGDKIRKISIVSGSLSESTKWNKGNSKNTNVPIYNLLWV